MDLPLGKTIEFGSIKDEWVRFGKTIRRCWKNYIIIWFILILILPLIGVGGARLTIYSIEPISREFPLEAYLYTFLGIEYHVTLGVFITTFVTLALSFLPIGVFFKIIISSIVSIVFQLFYPINRQYYRIERRYDKWSHRILGRSLNIGFVIYGVIIIIFVGFTINDVQDPYSYFINLLGTVIILAVPVVFGIIWWQYLRILNRQHKSQRKYFRQYLLSPHRMRTDFKGMCHMLAFLAVLGWLLLPFLFRSLDGIASGMSRAMLRSCEYSKKRQLIVGNDKIMGFLKSSDLWIPPPKESIAEDINFYSFMYGKTAERMSPAPMFMHYLFICATLAGFLSVGIPTVCLINESYGYRRTIKRLAINAGKTLIVTSVLQLLATRAFFINVSAIKGFSIAFLFIITYFLTHEAQETFNDKRDVL